MNAMKRIVNLMALAFAAASTVSCISEIAEPVQEMVKDENLELKELVFSASFEGRESDDDTRTALVNGREVYWLPGDQISIRGVEDPFTCTAAGPTPVTDFVGKAPEADKYYALYPASQVVHWDDFPYANIIIPGVQQAIKGSFANKLNTAVACADTDDMAFSFKNVLGYVKFTVPESLTDLVEVEIEAIGGEKLAGWCVVDCTLDKPYAKVSSQSSSYVRLQSESPMAPGSYYMAMIPGTYSAGLRFSFKNSAGQRAVKNISSKVTLSAGQIRNIGVAEGLIFKEDMSEAVPPDDEIWYLTSDDKAIKPSWNDASLIKDLFGAELVSNTYEDGKGVLKFNGPVTIVGEDAFINNYSQLSTLIGVSLPDSITEIGETAFWCGKITKIRIPKNVTRIDRYAFRNCDIRELVIPEKVTFIGEYAFANNPNLTKVTNLSEELIELDKQPFGQMYADSKLAGFEGKLVSSDGRCLINNNKLIACAPSGLTEYTIPETVTEIGDYVFMWNDHLHKIGIPSNVRKIGKESFAWSDVLLEVTVPATVEEVGYGAFQLCSVLKTANIYNDMIAERQFYNCPELDSKLIIPDQVTSIGAYAFCECANVTEVVIGSGVRNIGESAFSSCSLKSIYIPENVETIGDGAFKCETLEKIEGKFASGDNMCLIVDNTLVQLADAKGKTLIEYTIPEGVKVIGSSVFSQYANLTRVTIPEGVEKIGMHAFNGCNLSSLRLPSTLKYIENFMFCNNENLNEVFCYAIKPPGLSGSWFNAAIFKEGTIIRVPTESVDSYKNASIWNMYPIMDFDEEIYVSSDYSQDGAVKVVQQASVGNGIDIVFMGDAYSDRQIAAGDYEADINKAMEMLFSEEPYKSFRDHFNVYIVKAVSATEGYGLGSTAFSGYFGNGTEVGGDHNKVTTYAQKAISSSRMNEAVVIVMMNREYYAGTCYMYYPSVTSGYGNGLSISYFPLGTDDQMLAGLICHEAGGHGFSKLADEYSYESMGTIASDAVANHKAQQKDWGWWKNVDFTSDLSSIRWSHFLNDPRYQYDGLGAYEGGLTYWSGVWRPTENSIMRHNTGGFNAPSREAIYYRIHKLAYGNEWEYDYEEFVEYDARNRAGSVSAAAARPNYVEKVFEPTSPPVVIPHPWDERDVTEKIRPVELSRCNSQSVR